MVEMRCRPYIFILVFIVGMMLLPYGSYVLGQGRKVLLFDMEATIDSGVEDLLGRALSRYGGEVEAVVIILNTNGGYLYPTENIVDMILRSPVRVIVYVPVGGRAFSAGAYIALSSDTLAMAPGSVIGSAEPRSIGGVETDPKVVNAMAGWIDSLASFRGRNETAARSMVLRNSDYTAEDALRYNIADYISSSLQDLLGREGLGGYDIVRVSADVRSSLLSLLSDPFVVGLLVDIASLLILIEVFHPTFIGGMGAGVAFILALLGLGLIGTDATAITLLLLGIISILLEVKIGHGGPALIGSVLIALGTLLLYRQEYFIWTFNYTSLLIGGLVLIVLGTGIVGLYLHKIREVLRRRRSILDVNTLVGKEGVVRSRIEPGKPGIVLVMSDFWTALSDEVLEEGDTVRVVRVDGLKLYVEKVR
jgi:membrane-bound serine protease (ClpP class)